MEDETVGYYDSPYGPFKVKKTERGFIAWDELEGSDSTINQLCDNGEELAAFLKKVGAKDSASLGKDSVWRLFCEP